jgi:hypothetical protein
MSEEKTVLLSIKLDTGDLKKNSEEASAKILDLKAKQSILDKSTKEGALAYAKLNAEINRSELFFISIPSGQMPPMISLSGLVYLVFSKIPFKA